MYTVMTMNDSRWDKLAEILCRATEVKRGDKVLIEAIEFDSMPLLFALYRRALTLGAASVDYFINLPDLERYLLQNANEEQLSFSTDWELARMKEMDVYIGIRARTNGLVLHGIPSEPIKARRIVSSRILHERVDNTRWCITRIPTNYDASLAGMSTQEYMDYYFQAVTQDYEAMEKRNQILKNLMDKTDIVRIIAPGTNLQFSVKGIGVESCHGTCNIPDGEVFTAPVKESVEGTISYNVGSVYEGQNWTGVRFIIKEGRIIDAYCDQGKERINGLLDIDEDARYFGEFAIGTNRGITSPAQNIIFDEKIFGSFHLTPGSAHPETSNGNNSSIHWDLVKILTPEYGGGIIEFDGVRIMVDGKFVHPELAYLND